MTRRQESYAHPYRVNECAGDGGQKANRRILTQYATDSELERKKGVLMMLGEEE